VREERQRLVRPRVAARQQARAGRGRLGGELEAAAIKELSRLKYGRPREIVNAEIMDRAQLGASKPDDIDFSEATL
jgi:hypothetical protein